MRMQHLNDEFKEERMEHERNNLDGKIEMIGWGLLLIWWGLRWWILLSLPDGSGLVGSGVILLGSNLARSLLNIPTRGLTTWAGLLALTWGGLMVANETLHLPFELPAFEILLIVAGVILLGRGLQQARSVGLEQEA
jgi:hypothetical protein